MPLLVIIALSLNETWGDRDLAKVVFKANQSLLSSIINVPDIVFCSWSFRIANSMFLRLWNIFFSINYELLINRFLNYWYGMIIFFLLTFASSLLSTLLTFLVLSNSLWSYWRFLKIVRKYIFYYKSYTRGINSRYIHLKPYLIFL